MKIKEAFTDPTKLFFTSDTHFGHANIIKYCDRPFAGTHEMNQTLVDNWNRVVPKDGIVLHLGDFAFSDKKTISHIINSLKGKIYNIWGNHDNQELAQAIGTAADSHWGRNKTAGLYDLLEITVKDDEIPDGYQKIVLCHYPLVVWHGSHKGWWHLYGHVHGKYDHSNPRAIDVGVDTHDFTPISYQQVKEIITKRVLK